MTRAVVVSISVSPAGLYLNNYRAAIKLLEDPRPIWAIIGKKLVKSTIDRFYQGKSPEGAYWPPSGRVTYNSMIWSRATREQVIENLGEYRQSTSTLIKSGKLVKSFHYKTSRDGVVVYSDRKFGRVHQYGAIIRAKKKAFMKFKTTHGWKTVRQFIIPQRKFIGLTTQDRIMIRDVVKTYLASCYTKTVVPNE